MQTLVVHRLENLTSKAACSAAVQSSQSDISIEVTIFTANMRHVTQRQVSTAEQKMGPAVAFSARRSLEGHLSSPLPVRVEFLVSGQLHWRRVRAGNAAHAIMGNGSRSNSARSGCCPKSLAR